MPTIETLEIEVKKNASDASSGIEGLISTLTRLKTAVSGGAGLTSAVSQIKKLNTALVGIGNASSDLDGTLGKLKSISSIDFSNLKEAAKDLRALSKAATSASKVPEELPIEQPKAANAGPAQDLKPNYDLRTLIGMESMKEWLPAVGINFAKSVLGRVNDSAAVETFKEQNEEFKKIKANTDEAAKSVKSFFEAFKNAPVVTSFLGVLGLMRGSLSLVGKALGVAAKGTVKLAQGFATAAKTIGAGLGKLMLSGAKSLLSPIINLGKAFGNFIKSIGRIALYRLVRSAIKGISTAAKEGVNNLTRYSAALNSMDAAQANRTMSEYASTLQQVKNAIGAAVMPALTALLPIVLSIANAFITAANAVNQFLQALGGKGTFTRAKKNTTDYAKSLGGASGAAKELQKTLLGFDEINRLNDDSSNSGGAGGVDYGDMFEEAPVDSKIKSLAERIKEAFNSGDWNELASELAAKINEFSAKLLSIFETPGLKEKIAQMGAGLAEGLNTLVREINWLQLGQAIGAGLNLAIIFAVSFLYNVDWIQLGEKIAEFFNGMLEKIEWENVGKLLWAKFKIIFEMLAGFISKLDMKKLGDAFSKLTISFTNSITETVKKIDWQKLGQQVADLIRNINWNGIVDSIMYLLGAAFGAVVQLCMGLLGDAAKSIMNYFSNKIQENGGNVAKGLFKGILDGLGNIVTWLEEHIVKPFIQAICDLFGIHSPSTVMADIGKNVIEGFLGGLKDTWSSVKNWWTSTVGSWIESAKSSLASLANKLKEKVTPASTAKTGGGGTGRVGSFVSKVPGRANGGFVSSGELFVARESGPELVGAIGGRTAVANNDQIVQAVSSGVARAVASVMGTQRGQDIRVYLDGKDITASQNRRNRMYGVSTVGV